MGFSGFFREILKKLLTFLLTTDIICGIIVGRLAESALKIEKTSGEGFLRSIER